MATVCRDLSISILSLPFTAGTYRQRRNGSWYYDGTVSLPVLFLVLLSVVVVLTASSMLQTGADVRIGLVLLLLAILMVCGIVGCIILGYITKTRGLQTVVTARRLASLSKLQVAFIWIFGFFTGIFCILNLGQQVECHLFSLTLSDNGFYWGARFCYNVVLVLFVFTEILFFSYFSRFKLKRTVSVYYLMYVLLAANGLLMSHYFVMDHDFFPVNLTDVSLNESMLIEDCLQNGTMSKLIMNSVTILLPGFTEFGLLSLTIILEIWSPRMSSSPTCNVEMRDVCFDLESEETPLLPTLTPVAEMSSSGIHRSNRTLGHFVSYLLSVISGLCLILGYTSMALKHDEDVEQIRLVVETYELALKAAMILANLVGFFCLVHYCKPEVPYAPLKTKDYVYLLSAFGVIMVHICEAIVGDVISVLSVDPLLWTSICSVFQDYLQVVFLLHASRCQSSVPGSSVVLLDSALTFTMVINFSFWFNDSFLLSMHPNTRITLAFKFWYKVLLPISVFFRFSSFLKCFIVYKKLKSSEYSATGVARDIN